MTISFVIQTINLFVLLVICKGGSKGISNGSVKTDPKPDVWQQNYRAFTNHRAVIIKYWMKKNLVIPHSIINSPKAFGEFIGSLFQFWTRLFPILDTGLPLLFSLVFLIFPFLKFSSPLNLCFILILAQLGPAWPRLANALESVENLP